MIICRYLCNQHLRKDKNVQRSLQNYGCHARLQVSACKLKYRLVVGEHKYEDENGGGLRSLHRHSEYCPSMGGVVARLQQAGEGDGWEVPQTHRKVTSEEEVEEANRIQEGSEQLFQCIQEQLAKLLAEQSSEIQEMALQQLEASLKEGTFRR